MQKESVQNHIQIQNSILVNMVHMEDDNIFPDSIYISSITAESLSFSASQLSFHNILGRRKRIASTKEQNLHYLINVHNNNVVINNVHIYSTYTSYIYIYCICMQNVYFTLHPNVQRLHSLNQQQPRVCTTYLRGSCYYATSTNININI